MGFSGKRGVASAFACALLVMATAARAQEPSASARATARSLMDEGFDHREHGDQHGALEAFRAADALVHAPTAALEAARSELALGMLVEARNHLEAIAGATPAPNEPREFAEARDAAGQLADDLDARIPTLRIAIENDTRDPASLSIDGEAIPRAARNAAHRLNPGAHLLVVRASDGREARVSVTLREREARRVAMTLPDLPAPPRAAPPAPAPVIATTKAPARDVPAPVPGRDHTLLYVGAGVGGAGLVVGTVAGLSALSHRNSAASQCKNGECPSSSFHDLDAASTASSISNVGFVVAALGAAAVVTDLFILPHPKPAAGSTTVRPYVGAGTAGVHGTF